MFVLLLSESGNQAGAIDVVIHDPSRKRLGTAGVSLAQLPSPGRDQAGVDLHRYESPSPARAWILAGLAWRHKVEWVAFNITIKNQEQTTRCEEPHTLKVLRNPHGGYHVTCEYCDWWSTVPAGERLKGWDDHLPA